MYTVSLLICNLHYNDVIDMCSRALYDAFKYWSDVSPLTFQEVSATSTSDLTLKFASGEHGDGAGNAFDGPGVQLAHAYYPENGMMHYDEDETWTEYTDDGTNL